MQNNPESTCVTNLSSYSQALFQKRIFLIQKVSKPMKQNNNLNETLSDSEIEEEIQIKSPTKIENVQIPEFFNDFSTSNLQKKSKLYEEYKYMFKDKEDIALYCVPLKNFLK